MVGALPAQIPSIISNCGPAIIAMLLKKEIATSMKISLVAPIHLLLLTQGKLGANLGLHGTSLGQLKASLALQWANLVPSQEATCRGLCTRQVYHIILTALLSGPDLTSAPLSEPICQQ